MAEIVYILCALAGLACAGLLVRAYVRAPSRLLLGSAACFIALAANSILVVVDLFVVPQLDLRSLRLGVAAVGLFLMLWVLMTERK